MIPAAHDRSAESPPPGEQPQPSSVEATVQALTRVLDRTLRRVEQMDARMVALAEANADLAHTLVPAATPPPADPTDSAIHDREGPAGPGVRSWLLADDPAQAAADLDDLCAWVWRIYLWWPDAALSSCWLWHPEVIEELWWLRVAHTAAYDAKAGSSLRVADWHERHRPGVARRVRGVLVKCDLNRHVPFNNRPVEVVPPGPPALSAHAGQVAAVWTAGAGLDVIRAAGPEPSTEQLAEADAYQQALYRSRR